MGRREIAAGASLAAIALAGVPVMALGPDLFPAYKHAFFWSGVTIIVLALLVLLLLVVFAPKASVATPSTIHNRLNPPSPPRADGTDQHRVFVDSLVTPAFLVSRYKGVTAMQGDQAVAAHRDKWLRVEGIVDEVSQIGRIIRVTLFNDTASVILNFSRHDPRLESLMQGAKIAIVGRIDFVSRNGVTLEECEFVARESE